MSNVLKKITDADFLSTVQSSELMLAFFTTDYSGISKAMLPTVEAVCRKFDKKLDAFHARCEDCKESVAKFSIRRAPSIALFRNGKLVGVRVNVVKEDALTSFIEDWLKDDG